MASIGVGDEEAAGVDVWDAPSGEVDAVCWRVGEGGSGGRGRAGGRGGGTKERIALRSVGSMKYVCRRELT